MNAEFPEQPVSSFDALIEQLMQLDAARGWVFRGQEDANWKLRSSLERAVECFGGAGCVDVRQAEEDMVTRYQRSAHLLGAGPAEDDVLDQYARMQHHGAPTRLLDCTYSPYVAAYFALRGVASPRSADARCSVFALNYKALNESAYRAMEAHIPDVGNLRAHRNPMHRPGLFKELLRSDIPLIIQLSPRNLNERMVVQQGTFLCPGRAGSFEDDFRAVPDSDKYIKVFTLPLDTEVKGAALHALMRMNITEATLFPGFDGYCRGFAYTLADSRGRTR